MIYIVWIFSILIISFSSSASSEFYKYIDNNGNIRFTDDYSKVPKSQRTRIEKYDEYKNEKESIDVSTKKKDKSIPKEDLDEVYRRLNKKEQELALEYETLLKEQQALMNEQKSLTTEKIKQLNPKILMLNKKIEDYKTKREALNKEVKQYNAKVAEKNNTTKKGGKKIPK